MNTKYTAYTNTDTKSPIAEAIRRNPEAGPKPVSLEEYRRRHLQYVVKGAQPPTPPVSRKHRSGHKVKVRRALGEIYRAVALSSVKEKKVLLAKAREIQMAEFRRKQEATFNKLKTRNNRDQ